MEKESLLSKEDPLVEINFWGVRGSLPVSQHKFLKYGGNTPCVSCHLGGEQFLIFDAGTGINNLAQKIIEENISKKIKVFLSHGHWDHIQGLPFFAPFYDHRFQVDLYSPEASTEKLISRLMDKVNFPISHQDFKAHVNYESLGEGKYDFGSYQLETLFLTHSGKCLGYKVTYQNRVICYLCDHEIYFADHPHFCFKAYENLVNFVAEADVLINDAAYHDQEYREKVGWGHSCVSRACDLAIDAGVHNLYLFHHDYLQDDKNVDHKLACAREYLAQKGSNLPCFCAQEGSRVLLQDHSAPGEAYLVLAQEDALKKKYSTN